ncbi:hypothetical protein [Streptomyces sp. NPDC026659]|uniref:hypothetical protein n=1 Tax=Streptomyces sp. NPDC026659 TaxID=3155123 RepID=UPI0033E35F20
MHDRIRATAGNNPLVSLMEPVDGRLRPLTRRNTKWSEPLAEHRGLHEAITPGDRQSARVHALPHVRATTTRPCGISSARTA